MVEELEMMKEIAEIPTRKKSMLIVKMTQAKQLRRRV